MPTGRDGARRRAAGRRPSGPLGRRAPSAVSRRVIVVVALLLLVSAVRLVANQPSLAVSLYALIPIVLAAFWFGLAGGLLTGTVATLLFLADEVFYPSPELAGTMLALGVVNRSLVFLGVAVLVSVMLERERRLTLRIQQQGEQLAELESLRAVLTPTSVPARPHLEIATSFTPAEGVAAGDFFLVTEGPGDSTTVVVGDVVGHGLEAARCAAFVRAALSTFARFTSDPVQLLQLANAALVERRMAGTEFVTAVCLNIGGPPDRAVAWAAAGHDVPWCLDTATPLVGGRVSLPLGIGPEALTIEAGHLTLGPHEGILAFTDGLTEARAVRRDPAGSFAIFGEERARQVVRRQRGEPPARVLAALTSSVASFAGGPLADDLCLVAIRGDASAAG
jgi:serine phosphatase RsbU (regulator of sigma subunit)